MRCLNKMFTDGFHVVVDDPQEMSALDYIGTDKESVGKFLRHQLGLSAVAFDCVREVPVRGNYLCFRVYLKPGFYQGESTIAQCCSNLRKPYMLKRLI